MVLEGTPDAQYESSGMTRIETNNSKWLLVIVLDCGKKEQEKNHAKLTC